MFTVSISAQGQLSHLEPTQNDGSSTAVLCHSGQREGETMFFTILLHTVSHLNNHSQSLFAARGDNPAVCFTTTMCQLQGLLQGCNSMCAGYLFQQDKQYDVTYDTGDKALQCGRHVDIFKFWLMWKAKVCILLFFSSKDCISNVMKTTPFSFSFTICQKKGTVGFEQHIDKCLDLSAYLYNKIKNREGFEMIFNGEVRPLLYC